MAFVINKKRQASLKNINPIKKFTQTHSPPKVLPTISEYREAKKNNAVNIPSFRKI